MANHVVQIESSKFVWRLACASSNAWWVVCQTSNHAPGSGQDSSVVHARVIVSKNGVSCVDSNDEFASIDEFCASRDIFPCAPTSAQVARVNSYRRIAGLPELSLDREREQHQERKQQTEERLRARRTFPANTDKSDALREECLLHRYFFPNISRDRADLMLSGKPRGTYLVRPASEPSFGVVISVAEEFGAGIRLPFQFCYIRKFSLSLFRSVSLYCHQKH